MYSIKKVTDVKKPSTTVFSYEQLAQIDENFDVFIDTIPIKAIKNFVKELGIKDKPEIEKRIFDWLTEQKII